jgi:predicted ATPase
MVDLSGARDADDLVLALAKALDTPLANDPIAELGAALHELGGALVVLDGFEQTVAHAELLTTWRAAAPTLSMLVTTRIALDLREEDVVEVAPLSKADAIALITERAPELAGSPGLQALVARLDGLPLALELAATRLGVMSPEQLLARLDNRLRLLRARDAYRPVRHQTLRATVAWSWDLLEPHEQDSLCQLAVFTGSFTLEDAEAVVQLGPDAPWLLDVRETLIQHSLLSADERRVRMSETVRAYALEQHRSDQAEIRHGTHFARLGTNLALEALDSYGGARRRQELTASLDDLRLACARAMSRGDTVTASRTCRAAWQVLASRGPMRVGEALATAVLAMPDLALDDQGAMAHIAGDAARFDLRIDDANTYYEQALAAYRETGRRRGEGVVLGTMANGLANASRYPEAIALYLRAAEAFEEVDDAWSRGTTLGNLGVSYGEIGDVEQATHHLNAALEAHRSVGNQRSEAVVIGHLATLSRRAERWSEAEAGLNTALAIHRELGDRVFEATTLANLGHVARVRGDLDGAIALEEQVLTLLRAVGDRSALAASLGRMGALLRSKGELHTARDALDEARVVLSAGGRPRWAAPSMANLGEVYADLGRLDDARQCLEEALENARASSFTDLEVHVLSRLAVLDAREDDDAAAEHHLAQAEAIVGRIGGRAAALGVDIARADVCTWLGDAARALTLLDAVQAALMPGDRDLADDVATLRARIAD